MKRKKSRYVVHNWITYARLSVFDRPWYYRYHDIKVAIYHDIDSSTIAQQFFISTEGDNLMKGELFSGYLYWPYWVTNSLVYSWLCDIKVRKIR